LTAHTDADNPLNVIDPYSLGVIDVDVYHENETDGFV
jgi:hypothetical protein